MVYCEHCGRTDGCGYQDFHGKTVCFRCYRAARDQEFEMRQKRDVSADSQAHPEPAPGKPSQVRSLIDRFLRGQ